MPLDRVDREATLRKAEKLLRQGKLDLAIAEYRSVVEEHPHDWNTANILGDLYFRAGQVDKAVAEYGKIADHLASEGFLPKAVALYRKILKIKPDEERAMWHLGGISGRQGLLVEARANFLALAERRRARGDTLGEAEVRVRLGDLDGADLEARLAGARARVELGDAASAVKRLKVAAADLHEKGRESDALRLITEAAHIDPADADLRRLLVQAYLARRDFESASQFATSAGELSGVAEELFRQGRDDEGINVLRSAADIDPADTRIRARLAKLLIGRKDLKGARALLTPEAVGSDAALLWPLAETELRDGRIAEATAVLEQMLADDPSRRDALVILGCSVGEVNPDAGYECIDVAARAAVAADDWGAAAAVLNEFVTCVPNHIPALMRLVEICVDGGLEATMHSAQARLADAYLLAGAGLEARVIAEDLVAHAPWEPANIERFKSALTLLGETNIDAIIAERLSGDSPFTSTDLLWPAVPGETEQDPTFVETGSQRGREPVRDDYALDLSSILGETGKAKAAEVDLSDALHDLGDGDAGLSRQGRPAAPVESVLKGMRDEALHDGSPETAEQHFRLAGTYMQMGMQEDALKALAIAARSPSHQFRAGAMLAKASLEAGDRNRAIEWYERAADAPAPTPAAAHSLLYDLASALEAQGEGARALAVLLELRADAGEYRDVSVRLERLKMNMGS